MECVTGEIRLDEDMDKLRVENFTTEYGRTASSLQSVYCHVYEVRVTEMTGSSSGDWIYQHFFYKFP